MGDNVKIYLIPPASQSGEPIETTYGWLRSHPEERDALFRDHESHIVECGCRDGTSDPRLKLAVRHRGTNCYPVCRKAESVFHRKGVCPRHNSDGTVRVVSRKPGISEGEDGTQAALRGGLLRKRVYSSERISADPVLEEKGRGEREVANTIRGVYFLEFLWSTCGLNRHDPRAARVDLLDVQQRLGSVVSKLQVTNAKRSHNLVSLAPSAGIDDFGVQLKDKLHSIGKGHVMLLLGEYHSHEVSLRDVKIYLHGHISTPLHIGAEALAEAEVSYRALNSVSRGRRFFMAVECYLDANNRIQIERISWIRCQQEYLPFNSEHEARALDKAVAEGRRFRKPLQWEIEDSPGQMLHDFVFLDVPGFAEYPGEIWDGYGEDADYVVRKEYKRARCGKNLWEWDADVRPNDIPPFPPKC